MGLRVVDVCRLDLFDKLDSALLLLLFLLTPAHILWQKRTESALACPIHKASANGGVECCGIDVVSIASNGALWRRQSNQQGVVNNPIKQQTQTMNLAHTETYQSPHVMYTMHHAHNGISLLGRTRTVMTHKHTPASVTLNTLQAHKPTRELYMFWPSMRCMPSRTHDA